MRIKSSIFSLAVLAAIAFIALSGTGASARRACTPMLVTESDVTRQPHGTQPTDNWVLYTRGAGSAVFANGPSTPPINGASLQFTTPPNDGNAKAYLFNYDHIGTPLTSITEISYSTYRSSAAAGPAFQVPALNLEIDYNGAAPGGYAILVYEPIYTHGNNAITLDTWQTWNATAGKWWTPQGIPGVCANNCFVTWNDIVSANQTAVITKGFGVNVGGGNPGMIGAADGLHIAYGTSCFTYDFDVDSDSDDVADAADNCPNAANADQADADDDGQGDVCDTDDDNDGVNDANDLCPNTPANTQVGASGCPLATAKEQCKNGGWKTLTRADGTAFKNQGDCVQYTTAGK